MKKLIVLSCACMMAGMTFAQSVRIGNMEISVKKVKGDTLTQVLVDEPCPPCPPCPSENETRPRTKPTQFSTRENRVYIAYGGNRPYNGAYPISNSFNFDVGGMDVYRLSRHFALMGTLGYSF
ncbi:MAG: hypothetical protein LBN37_03255, partial [Bacteroidales bacterium]|nr:hypothetical protein [Bacteroidales bacterium]